MIQEYIDKFQEIKPKLLKQFEENEPDSYKDILVQTIEMMFPDSDYNEPNISELTVLDHGDYQGTQVFIMPESGYQPNDYFVVKVSYGSCSGCDTYEAYSTYGDDPKRSAPEMLTMALHMIQSLKKV